ncbi:MAG TPA: hypothetical protein VHU18_12260 [Rhizomicrobium sp.]|nr:hypothetical protein [Rhizomicrobium sp.]
MSPDIKTIWQNQPVEETPVSLSDLQSRAQAFRRRVRWRNAALYLYSLFNIVVGGWLIYRRVFPTLIYPMLLMIAAHLFVLWQVVTRIGENRVPESSLTHGGLDYLRQQYERQRQGLGRAWLWYIAPFMGPFLWELAIWLRGILAHPGTPAQAANIRLFVMTIVSAILFWGTVWWLFRRGARRWQAEIAGLDRIRAE